MDSKNGMRTTATPRELTLTRVFDAPRELVFKVWIDPQHLAQWWGPRHFSNPVCEVDARPGGAILIHMQGPDGGIYPMTGTFEEIIEPERIVFTSAALESEGGDPILEVRNTVTFEDLDGKTKFTLHAVVFNATPAAEGPLSGMEQGWSESLDKLAEYVVAAAS